MSKKQLFLYSLVMVLVLGNGNGMGNMIPVYLSRLEVGPDAVGLLFSLLYLALSGAGILAGWLSDRFHRRKLMCVASAAGEILASLFMFGAQSVAVFSVALFISWFLAGIHIALVYTLVGLQAEKHERGRVFGILGFIMGFGPILSGFFYGQIVDQFGFSTLFALNIVISVAWTVLSLLYKDVPATPKVETGQAQSSRPLLKSAFVLLTVASIFGWITINGGKLGITLVMNRLSFSAGDISFTAGVASLVALGMPLVLGWLSDKIGRKPLMIGLNLVGIVGLLILSQTAALPGFCLASALLSVFSSFAALTSAFTADLVPRQSLGLGLSIMNNTSNMAGILSSALLGWALGGLGAAAIFLIASLLPLAAIFMMARIEEARPIVKAATQ
jgi:MFS family permease